MSLSFRPTWRLIALIAILASGCALGGSRGRDAGGASFDASAAPDARSRFDGGAVLDGGAMPRTDAGGVTSDAGGTRTDAGPTPADAGSTVDAGSLSPELALPDPAGAVCDYPGNLSECPGIEVCRFYSPMEGRCESCEPCGNLNAFCSSSSECDILFMCFRGRCTNFCTLGLSECGPPDDCLDIGHPTRGVCRP